MNDPDYAAHYVAWHDDTAEHRSEMADWYRRLLAPVLRGLAPESRILDVGCGTGMLVGMLIESGFAHTEGVDISPGQIAIAERYGLPCRLIERDDLGRLAREYGTTFDLICLIDVLEHIAVDEQIGFLRAAAALLVPGGRLVLAVPNASSSFAARMRWIDHEHRCSFTEHSLTFVLHAAGLRELKLHPHEYGPALRSPWVHQASFWTRALRRMFRALRRLEAVAEFGRRGLAIPLSLNLLAECRKPAAPEAPAPEQP